MRESWSGRLLAVCELGFALALRVFPRDFRDASGDEIAESFRDACRDAQARGVVSMVWTAVRGMVDAVVQGVIERLGRIGVTGAWQPRRGPGSVTLVRRELGQAVRSLGRAPSFVLVCFLTFTLVVGAAAGIFGAIDVALLRPLPYPAASSLVFVGERPVGSSGPAYVTSGHVLHRIAETSRTLDDVAVFNIWEATLTGEGEPVRLSGAQATWNYFRSLRRSASLGRTFREGDGATGGSRIVVVSDRLWRQRLGGGTDVIGRFIELSGVAHEIVGVMPPDFIAPDDYLFGSRIPDIWRPAEFGNADAGVGWLRGIARMRPGLTHAQVAREMESIRERIGEQYPDWAKDARIAAIPLQEQVTSAVRPVLVLLGAMAVLVLVVGCANLANLVLARGIGRMREVELRSALGASRGQAVRPLVLEVFVLGVAGAMAGLALAGAGIRILVSVAPPDLPRLDAMGIDFRVVAIGFAVSLAIAALSSVVPALRLRPAGGLAGLAAGTRGGTTGRAHHRAQSAFAVVQLAFALAVLSVAALLGRSLWRLLSVDPGFRAEGLYATQLDLPASRYADRGAQRQFAERIASDLAERPGIVSASWVTTLPQHGLNNMTLRTPVRGRSMEGETPWAAFRAIGPDYFATLDIPVSSGRGPEPADWAGDAMSVAFVSEAFARRFFPHGDAVGQSLQINDDDAVIAGVVGSVRYGWLGADTDPEVYVPYRGGLRTIFLVARTSGGAAIAAGAIRSAVASADPLLPAEIISEEALLARSTAGPRFATSLLALLASIAVTLSAVGLYGVISHAVSERRREFGIRLALGAGSAGVAALVLRRGMLIASCGTALGLLVALSVNRLIANRLYGIDARDPLTLGAAALVLAGVALAAGWYPARRAAGVDPAVALRSE